MGQKIKLQTFVQIFTKKTDGFYTFYISQGSVATQLRCGGMFGNHFTTNFSQNSPVKKFENWSIFGKDMDKTLRLTFWATLYMLSPARPSVRLSDGWIIEKRLKLGV